MKALVREAMRDGAVGLSTALQYAPAPYAKTGRADRAGGGERPSWAASTPRTSATKATPSCRAMDEAVPHRARSQHPGGDLASKGRRARRIGGACRRSSARIEKARANPAWISAPTPTRTPRGSIRFSAVIPPWAHDGGDEKLIERLEGPGHARAHPQGDGNAAAAIGTTSGRRFPGRRRFLVGAVQNPKLLPLQGKTIAEIAEAVEQGSASTRFSIC